MPETRWRSLILAMLAAAILVVLIGTPTTRARQLPRQPQLTPAPRFGTVGLVLGQTARLNAVNDLPSDPISFHFCTMTMTYVGPSGEQLKDKGGKDLSKVFDVEPEQSVSFDLVGAEVLRDRRRLQFRPVLEFQRDGTVPDPCQNIVATLEIFDTFTGRTSVLYVPPVSGHPADDDRETTR